ncbi:MAG: ribosome small subunit-dependent GTPase A [Propionibacteriaceae bacterium]|nr:ribosome small subunit-dependent GTPase A [Propionibacteriaceae bacterium]
MNRKLSEAITDDPHAGFGRPPRHTRPRTKARPSYADAEAAMVVRVDRGRFGCLVATTGITVTATKARSLGRSAVIVGDEVNLVGDTSGNEGTLARIVEVGARRTLLMRTADDDDPYERPIVANADQLVIVTALADPAPRPGMIDRILVAAYDGGLEPLLIFTKADLASVHELTQIYEPLGLRMLTSEPGADHSELLRLLTGQVSVLVGHSGVGKSTLVNALIPGVDRATAEVNEVTGKGRHTSTSAIALRLPSGDGWVIDTPGVRSFGLSHVTVESIVAAFGDLDELAVDCPRGCTHETGTLDCAFDSAVADGKLAAGRLESFRRIEKAWM